MFILILLLCFHLKGGKRIKKRSGLHDVAPLSLDGLFHGPPRCFMLKTLLKLPGRPGGMSVVKPVGFDVECVRHVNDSRPIGEKAVCDFRTEFL